MRAWLLSVLSLTLLYTGCSEETKWSAVDRLIETRFSDVSEITTDSLAERLAASDSIVLLDARTLEEYEVSHIPGARRIDPSTTDFSEFDSMGRDAPIVVYCSVGYRSARVADRLQDAGFRNVSNVRGSIFRWVNEGRRVVRGDSTVREVHPYDDTWGDLLNPSLHAYEPGASIKK
ncbi:sulfurtransferase [Longibacter salinarum]|uniref:Sulfurtransferase n=1 Tax=Longibacter salinarum TaxID=1850348 RepID=A0A2A8D333_9BACT|nr:rhodanese-like domain-containing protein [Longibacter salinarum]PEN15284.1 sulfurtransferase [Longibacter salinarum]